MRKSNQLSIVTAAVALILAFSSGVFSFASYKKHQSILPVASGLSFSVEKNKMRNKKQEERISSNLDSTRSNYREIKRNEQVIDSVDTDLRIRINYNYSLTSKNKDEIEYNFSEFMTLARREKRHSTEMDKSIFQEITSRRSGDLNNDLAAKKLAMENKKFTITGDEAIKEFAQSQDQVIMKAVNGLIEECNYQADQILNLTKRHEAALSRISSIENQLLKLTKKQSEHSTHLDSHSEEIFDLKYPN